jgi:hypothetical protein
VTLDAYPYQFFLVRRAEAMRALILKPAGLAAVAVAVMGLLVPITAQAATAGPGTVAGFPAPGVYQPSPSGIHLGPGTPMETITTTMVSLSGFEILVQITNVSNSPITTGCSLPTGKKSAPDTMLLIKKVKGRGYISEKGYDSTCTENPNFVQVLSPHQSGQYFVAFRLPPGLGRPVKISSVFAPNGTDKTYTTRQFNPYATTAGLKVRLELPPPGRELADVYHDGYELAADILELDGLGVEIDDISLLNPWLACGNSVSCLQQQLPTPFLPSLSTT